MAEVISCFKNSKINAVKTRAFAPLSIWAFALTLVLLVFQTSKNCTCQLRRCWIERVMVASERECSFLSNREGPFISKIPLHFIRNLWETNNSGKIYCLTKEKEKRLAIKIIQSLQIRTRTKAEPPLELPLPPLAPPPPRPRPHPAAAWLPPA